MTSARNPIERQNVEPGIANFESLTFGLKGGPGAPRTGRDRR